MSRLTLNIATMVGSVFALLFCPPAIAAPGAITKPGATAKPAASFERIVLFPKDQAIGALFIGRYRSNIDERGEMNQVGGAIGTVKVNIPPGYFLLLEANRRVFQNPAVLQEVSANGLDALKLGFVSMDDSEDGLCNKALANVDHLSTLSDLNLDRSDANDAGLAVVSKLKNLKSLSCFGSEVTGSFLKNLVGLLQFHALNIAWCSISQANFKYLAQIPKLDFLNATRTGLDLQGAKEISKCTQIKNLRISSNAKFNDECLKLLLPLKKLTWLEIDNTPVTMNGFKSIKGLKLRTLSPPDRFNNVADQEELKRIFPGVLVRFKSKHVDSDVQKTFAPLR